jgi:hypothetical protein
VPADRFGRRRRRAQVGQVLGGFGDARARAVVPAQREPRVREQQHVVQGCAQPDCALVQPGHAAIDQKGAALGRPQRGQLVGGPELVGPQDIDLPPLVGRRPGGHQRGHHPRVQRPAHVQLAALHQRQQEAAHQRA